MAVVDIIEFLLMALEVTGKFKGKNFHLQKKDESFTWRSSYSWRYVYFYSVVNTDSKWPSVLHCLVVGAIFGC